MHTSKNFTTLDQLKEFAATSSTALKEYFAKLQEYRRASADFKEAVGIDPSGDTRETFCETVNSLAREITRHASDLVAAPFHVDIPEKTFFNGYQGATMEDLAGYCPTEHLNELIEKFGNSSGENQALSRDATTIFNRLLFGWVNCKRSVIEPKVGRAGVSMSYSMSQDNWAAQSKKFEYSYYCRDAFTELVKALQTFANWAGKEDLAEEWEDAKAIAYPGKFRGESLDSRMKCEMTGLTLTLFKEKITFTFSHSLADKLQEFLGLYRERHEDEEAA